MPEPTAEELYRWAAEICEPRPEVDPISRQYPSGLWSKGEWWRKGKDGEEWRGADITTIDRALEVARKVERDNPYRKLQMTSGWCWFQHVDEMHHGRSFVFKDNDLPALAILRACKRVVDAD